MRVRVKGDEGEWGVEGEGASEARGIKGRLRVMQRVMQRVWVRSS